MSDAAARAQHDVPRVYTQKWQKTLDLIATLFEADAVLVRRVTDVGAEVLVSNRAPTVPFLPGERQAVGSGAYGEAVVRQRAPLVIGSARDALAWRAALPVNRAMQGYTGVPLIWPDRSVFGVLEVLNRVARPYPAELQQLLGQLKELIESDFRIIHLMRSLDGHKAQLEEKVAVRTLELRQANQRLEEQLAERKRLEEALRELAIGGTGGYGEAYFRNLVLQLTRLFGADHAYVAALEEDPSQARTLAFYSNGCWLDAQVYPAEELPGALLRNEKSLLISDGLEPAFGAGHLLERLRAVSFAGAPLRGVDGQPLGILAVLGNQPLREQHLAQELLELLAVRTSTEIQRMRAEQHLRRLAHEDYLTGLASRSLLYERLREMVSAARGVGGCGAALTIDLDNFKNINDAFGHETGDQVLREVGARLRDTVTQAAFVARLGGDEFVALMPPRAGRSLDEAAAQARSLAEALLASMNRPLQSGQQQALTVGASIGIAIFPDGEPSEMDVLRRADVALYHAKAAGRRRAQLFAGEMQERMAETIRLANGLRDALCADQFHLQYQPQVNGAGHLIGAEALLRWVSPADGSVSPDRFIKIAEENGLIHAIGEWCLHAALRQLGEWQRLGVPFGQHLSVNVSPWQFARDDFVETVDRALSEHAVAPTHLMLELTESALLYDVPATVRKLAALRAQGVRVSLDDFGTGYSSLAYLRDLPLDELKIDRNFVAELLGNRQHPLVGSMVAIGRQMDLQVIAEGVETDAQLQRLLAYGCNGFQGYLFGRPMLPSDFALWSRARM